MMSLPKAGIRSRNFGAAMPNPWGAFTRVYRERRCGSVNRAGLPTSLDSRVGSRANPCA